VRDVAAHRARIRLDTGRVEADPLEDALVRAVLRLVALLEPGLIGVERVRVLHHELARAQQSRARTRFVPTLRLEVIDHDRQLTIRKDLRRRVRVNGLFVCVAHHELTPVVVLGAERDRLQRLPAAGRLPEVAGGQDGHLHLLAADAVHLLADDLLDLRRDAEAERQPGVQARRERAGDGGAEHQLVTTRLCISGRLAERASEQGRLSHGVNSEGRIWPRGTRPAPQGRRLARDSVRGPSRTHRANTTDGAAWLLRKAEGEGGGHPARAVRWSRAAPTRGPARDRAP